MKQIKKDNKEVTTVRFSAEQKQLIGRCARLNSVSKSRVVQEAINEYFHTK
jgi:predicted DNA-binding protein